MTEKEKPGRAWRGKSLNTNAARNKHVRKRMDEFEARTGITLEQFRADMRAQRLRVLARYGVTPTEDRT